MLVILILRGKEYLVKGDFSLEQTLEAPGRSVENFLVLCDGVRLDTEELETAGREDLLPT
jgi:hypothetical protein